MVHVVEATVGRRYAGWYIRNTEHSQRVLDQIRDSPLPKASLKASGVISAGPAPPDTSGSTSSKKLHGGKRAHDLRKSTYLRFKVHRVVVPCYMYFVLFCSTCFSIIVDENVSAKLQAAECGTLAVAQLTCLERDRNLCGATMLNARCLQQSDIQLLQTT